jgi:hypothetical protein
LQNANRRHYFSNWLKARSHYTTITITITCIRALIGQKCIVIVRLKKKSLGWAVLKSLSSNDNFIVIFLPIIACLQVIVSLSLCNLGFTRERQDLGLELYCYVNSFYSFHLAKNPSEKEQTGKTVISAYYKWITMQIQIFLLITNGN